MSRSGGNLLQTNTIGPPESRSWMLRRTGLALAVLLLLSGCSEKDTPLSFRDGPRGDPLGLPETLSVGAPTADAGIRPVRTTGTALSLLIGLDAEMEARGLVRFGSIPDTADVHGAYLRLHVRHGRGEPIRLAIRRVIGTEETWSADDVTYMTAPAVDPIPIVDSVLVETGDVSDTVLVKVPFPLEQLLAWKALPDSNAGIEIALDPTEDGGGIARISSHHDANFDEDGTLLPSPALILVDSLGTDLRGTVATADAYVVRDLRPRPTGADTTAVVGSGNPGRFVLRFDLSALSPDVSIVRATVHLPLPAGQISEDLKARLAVYEVTEAWDEGSAVDSLATAGSSRFIRTFEDGTAQSIDLEIGGLAQDWLEGRENFGFLVRFADETSLLQDLVFFTRESRTPPTLTITYLAPLSDRWEGLK